VQQGVVLVVFLEVDEHIAFVLYLQPCSYW